MAEIGENEKKLLEAARKVMNNAHVLWGVKVGGPLNLEMMERFMRDATLKAGFPDMVFAPKDVRLIAPSYMVIRKSQK